MIYDAMVLWLGCWLEKEKTLLDGTDQRKLKFHGVNSILLVDWFGLAGATVVVEIIPISALWVF